MNEFWDMAKFSVKAAICVIITIVIVGSVLLTISAIGVLVVEKASGCNITTRQCETTAQMPAKKGRNAQ